MPTIAITISEIWRRWWLY